MTGEVGYIEMGASDARVTSRFFANLFNWPFHTMGDHGDGWFETPGIKTGLHGNDTSNGTVVYFRVIDIEEAAVRVRELGGEVEEPGTKEPGFGRFFNCCDPQGLRFGLFQS